MKKNLLFLIPAIGFIGFSFFYKGEKISTYHNDGIETVNFSSNPPAEKTGAPGDGNCTDCHMGATMSAEGVVDFSVGGGPGYIPGNTYPFILSSIGGSRNGFQLTVLDASNNAAGTFTAGTGSSVTTSGGREYVRHSDSGVDTWVFDWTAPGSDMGELTAYYAVNKANDNGENTGDEIFLGTTAIPLFGASIEENELDKAYKIFFNDQTGQLNLSYSLLEESKVVLNIQDLSGKLIEYYDFGSQPTGDYNELLPVTQVESEGIYVLSLFVDNKVFNRKVLLK